MFLQAAPAVNAEQTTKEHRLHLTVSNGTAITGSVPGWPHRFPAVRPWVDAIFEPSISGQVRPL